MVNRPLVGVDIHLSVQQKVVSPHIIQTRYMVLVLMRKYHSVQNFDLVPEHLLPKIGSGIKYQGRRVALQQACRPEAVVSGIS